jgi:hypothetical protein
VTTSAEALLLKPASKIKETKYVNFLHIIFPLQKELKQLCFGYKPKPRPLRVAFNKHQAQKTEYSKRNVGIHDNFQF